MNGNRRKAGLVRSPQIVAARMLAIAALSGCSGGSGPIEAGYWETTTRASAGATELWTSTVSRCIVAPETEDPVPGLLRTSPLGACTARESRYQGGTLAVRADCPGQLRPMGGGMPRTAISVEGRYTPTTIDGRFTAQLPTEPDNPGLSGSITGRRTGDCPL